MEQLHLSLAEAALFASLLVSLCVKQSMEELAAVFVVYTYLGLCSVGFSTAAPCDFRTRSELDRYLEASQIRQRAIERINDVTGTYELFLLISFKADSIFTSLYLLVSKTYLNLMCRYIDLRDRIFSKHPDLFPAEVQNSIFTVFVNLHVTFLVRVIDNISN